MFMVISKQGCHSSINCKDAITGRSAHLVECSRCIRQSGRHDFRDGAMCLIRSQIGHATACERVLHMPDEGRSSMGKSL